MPEPAKKPSRLKTIARYAFLAAAAAFGAAFPFYILPTLLRLPPVVVGLAFGLPIAIAIYAQARQRERRVWGTGSPSRSWWAAGSLPLATESERMIRSRARLCVVVLVVSLCVMMASIAFFRTPAAALAGVAVIWVTLLVMLTLTTKLSAAHFTALKDLRQIGYRVCPGCTYDLVSTPHGPGVCPECGLPFDDDSLKERWEVIYELLQKKPGLK